MDLGNDVKNSRLSVATFRFIKCLPSMSMGSFLCFAAVEYDDLYSLQWLCETHGIPHTSYMGFNLLHFAALFGRIEIVGWLRTVPSWDSLVNEASTYDALYGAYTVHIAAGQGHTYLADLLLELGCNEKDSRENGPEVYAMRAPIVKSISFDCDYKFAFVWATKKISGE